MGETPLQGDADRADSREYFSTLEDAMEGESIPLENRPMVREIALRIPYREVYVPSRSRKYIALVDPESSRMNAAMNPGFFEVHSRVVELVSDFVVEGDDPDWKWIILPVNHVREGGGSRSRLVDVDHGICDTCFTTLPATGVCDNCA